VVNSRDMRYLRFTMSHYSWMELDF